MIAYIINGKSFGNCVDYVTRKSLEERLVQEQSKQQKADEKKYEANDCKDIMEHLSKDWKLIAATGDVRIYEGRKAMAEDIARPTKMRKSIKDPVGHISLDFHPKDAPMMTDDLMADIAQEYMSQMGMSNTPFIVVRHYDKEHPHCHIVFSRVDNEKKILTQTTNFKRNERVCKAINKKLGLNTSQSKENTNVKRLRGREKVRYEIFNICSDSFRNLYNVTWQDFVAELKRNGVTVEYKLSPENPNKVTGLFYVKDGKRFPSSKIDRRFTYYGIYNALKKTEHLRIKPQGQTRPSSTVQREAPQVMQPNHTTKQSAPKPIIVPPLPKNFMGARIAPHAYAAYERGEVICAGIVKPGDITVTHCWIWYDFKTGRPRCESAMPSNRYIPEAFTRQLEADRTSCSHSQGTAITLSRPSMGGAPVEDQGFAHGGGISDDFKRFLERHPDLTIDEALCRFKDEQKARQRRKGLKL